MFYRILVFAFAASALLFAIGGLEAESDRLRVAGAELDLLRNQVNRDDLLAAQQVLSQHGSDCRNELRRAATALSSAGAGPAVGEEARLLRLKRTEESIQAQLRCSPADGNAWLLLAYISHQVEKPEAEIQYAKLSQSNSPREGWIIERRIDFICSTAKSSFDQLANVVQRDFEVLLRDRRFEKVADHYSRCRGQPGAVLEGALTNVGSEIREAFARDMASRAARSTR